KVSWREEGFAGLSELLKIVRATADPKELLPFANPSPGAEKPRVLTCHNPDLSRRFMEAQRRYDEARNPLPLQLALSVPQSLEWMEGWAEEKEVGERTVEVYVSSGTHANLSFYASSFTMGKDFLLCLPTALPDDRRDKTVIEVVP
ncbi:MAG TPA: hypothetical protein VKU00_34080, partial [Chthonomonadaceae bacterium]|nr:hypothetical protein [Chthonomonadaceae bacterium]